MVLDIDEIRKRLDAVRASRLERALELQDQIRQLEETLDELVGLMHEAVQSYDGEAMHSYAGDGDSRLLDPKMEFWAEYGL